jgi:hypothetical protein
MSVIELRDLDEARAFVTQGLWLQRLATPAKESVAPALEWALAAAASDQCVPAVGFVSDLGHALLSVAAGQKLTAPLAIPGFPPGLARAYEDYVLGKIAADFSLERAVDALRRYQRLDQGRGLAFVLQQMQQRSGFQMVTLSPAVLKGLQRESPERTLKEGWDSLLRDGLMPELVTCYESLVQVARQTAEFLGPEDIFELEHGTALAEFGQRVALRQVLQAADTLDRSLSPHRPRPRTGQQQVPTRVLAEDTYPVGGFSSLSTRGTIESLLQSQLALMEKSDRPDLFDVKYVRDELLYYSRDENQFFRRRKTFVIVLQPDLVQARFKDAQLAWQRVVLLLALIVVAVRRLCDWLSEDALRFELVFLEPGAAKHPLADEHNLLQTLLREQIANTTVALLSDPSLSVIAARCALHGRRSLCHCLIVGLGPQPLTAEDTQVCQLNLASPHPELTTPEEMNGNEPQDALGAWVLTLENLLQLWI